MRACRADMETDSWPLPYLPLLPTDLCNLYTSVLIRTGEQALGLALCLIFQVCTCFGFGSLLGFKGLVFHVVPRLVSMTFHRNIGSCLPTPPPIDSLMLFPPLRGQEESKALFSKLSEALTRLAFLHTNLPAFIPCNQRIRNYFLSFSTTHRGLRNCFRYCTF